MKQTFDRRPRVDDLGRAGGAIGSTGAAPRHLTAPCSHAWHRTHRPAPISEEAAPAL
jgi:hypothetical protein